MRNQQIQQKNISKRSLEWIMRREVIYRGIKEKLPI